MILERKKFLNEKELQSKIGQFLTSDDYDLTISQRTHNEPVHLISEEGDHVCTFVPKALSLSFVAKAHEALIDAASWSSNRAEAGGSKSGKRIREDGSVSKSVVSEPVRSSIIGYFDRNTRFNYCRECAWNNKNPDKWQAALPIIQQVSNNFEVHAKEKFFYQKQIADKVHPDFLIPGTVFTTITVNKNFRTACHRDGENLNNSFSCFNVMSQGQYIGGGLVFPRYRVAIFMNNDDVLYFCPQEPHGNTEIKPMNKVKFERISLVYYLREPMLNCGSMEEEMKRGIEIHGCKFE